MVPAEGHTNITTRLFLPTPQRTLDIHQKLKHCGSSDPFNCTDISWHVLPVGCNNFRPRL